MPFPLLSADNYGVDVLANHSVVTNFSPPQIQMLDTALKILNTRDVR